MPEMRIRQSIPVADSNSFHSLWLHQYPTECLTSSSFYSWKSDVIRSADASPILQLVIDSGTENRDSAVLLHKFEKLCKTSPSESGSNEFVSVVSSGLLSKVTVLFDYSLLSMFCTVCCS